MKSLTPLSVERLGLIFRTSSNNPNRLIKREDSNVEFKEAYNHGSMAMYFKTIASFANKNGGYIIFGVKDKPRELLGLNGKSLQQFEELRVEEFTMNLCDYFAPEIQWVHGTYEFRDKQFGVIYILELEKKPAICKKNYDNKDDKSRLKEGDVFYRYGGRSERIKYTELSSIIDKQRQDEEKQWLGFISKVSKIGVENAGILNLNTGIIDGKSGSVLIDESLLSQIAFIKEGEFSEKEGKPTLKLIGNIESINAGKLIIKQELIKVRGITEIDIIESFLNNSSIEFPIDYITQICHCATGFLPVYYYIRLAKLNIEEILEIISAVNIRSQAKKKLIERLSENRRQYIIMSSTMTKASKKKNTYQNMFIDQNLPESIESNDMIYCIQAIRNLTNKEIIEHLEYIKAQLLALYQNNYSNAIPPLADSFRRAFCRIDEAEYDENI